MDNFQKIIINFWQPQTAIYRYTSFLSEIGDSIQINVIDDKIKWNAAHKGIDFYGRFSKSFLNTILPKYSHSDLVRYLKEMENGNTIFHYTSQRDVILTYSKNTLFTLHDNPFSLFDTDLYSNGQVNGLQKLHKKFGKFIFKYNCLNSPYITTNTNYVKNALRKYGYNGYIETVYHPVSKVFRKLGETKTKLRTELNLPLDKILLLSVSNKVFRKNLPLIEELGKEISNDYVIIRVGEGIKNSINFNWADDETLNRIYNACDALLFPSLEEGQGLPVIEAFSAGLPVVVSDIPVLREVAGNAAIFIDPHDVKSLYNGVKEALNINEQLKETALVMSKKYSVDIFKNKMDKLYRYILQNGSNK